MPPDISDMYLSAKKYMLHAPVLKCNQASNTVSIFPLNPLPVTVDANLATCLGMPDLSIIERDQMLLYDIYHCNVVPLERKPLHSYTKHLSPARIFGELDFEAVPICVQPTLCLVNWLRARGIDMRMSDERVKIEFEVANCIRVNKLERLPALQPVVGEHNAYRKIRSRSAQNEYDTWNRDYFSITAKVQFITDDARDIYLGETRKSRPSIRQRVANLFNGGHYDPKTMDCRNVETLTDGTPCVLIRCKCLSSKSSVLHTTYAVFEDKPDGKYLVDESNCSCKKGEHFCSHLIGFLYLVNTMQQALQLNTPHSRYIILWRNLGKRDKMGRNYHA
jgi:hypothetical protein